MTIFLCICLCVFVFAGCLPLMKFLIRINSLKEIFCARALACLKFIQVQVTLSLYSSQCYIQSIFFILSNLLGKNILLALSFFTGRAEYLFKCLLTICNFPICVLIAQFPPFFFWGFYSFFRGQLYMLIKDTNHLSYVIYSSSLF